MPKKSLKVQCLCGVEVAHAGILYQHPEHKRHRFKCVCGKIFAALADLRQHHCDSHQNKNLSYVERPTIIGWDESSRNSADYAAPTAKDSNISGSTQATSCFACPASKSPFKSLDSLRDHLRDAHGISMAPQTMAIAPKSALDASQSKDRAPQAAIKAPASQKLTNSYRAPMRSTSCSVCPNKKPFSSFEALCYHTQDCHPKITSQVNINGGRCPVCQTIFPRIEALESHWNGKHGAAGTFDRVLKINNCTVKLRNPEPQQATKSVPSHPKPMPQQQVSPSKSELLQPKTASRELAVSTNAPSSLSDNQSPDHDYHSDYQNTAAPPPTKPHSLATTPPWLSHKLHTSDSDSDEELDLLDQSSEDLHKHGVAISQAEQTIPDFGKEHHGGVSVRVGEIGSDDDDGEQVLFKPRLTRFSSRNL